VLQGRIAAGLVIGHAGGRSSRLGQPEADSTAFAQGYPIAQMTQAIFRDLEELLNTRVSVNDVPAR
jgi:predicted component of type VI protein secretion system